MDLKLILAAYGAVLSTSLAVLTLVKFLRDRPSISVEATTVFSPSSEGADTHGILICVKRGDDELWEEVDIELCIRNSGDKACQICDVFIEQENVIQQIRPEGLPVVLEPRTQSVVRVQPEYFAPKVMGEKRELVPDSILAAGVFDALGEKHSILSENFEKLVDQCATLPVRTSVYQHKETGNHVIAFKVKDASKIVRKNVDST